MSNSEVTELLIALRSGAMSLDEVEDRFKVRSWPRTRGARPRSFSELTTTAQVDPGGSVHGSIDDLTAAYDRGEITREQYRTLAHAVAFAINTQSRREPPDDGAAG